MILSYALMLLTQRLKAQQFMTSQIKSCVEYLVRT